MVLFYFSRYFPLHFFHPFHRKCLNPKLKCNSLGLTCFTHQSYEIRCEISTSSPLLRFLFNDGVMSMCSSGLEYNRPLVINQWSVMCPALISPTAISECNPAVYSTSRLHCYRSYSIRPTVGYLTTSAHDRVDLLCSYKRHFTRSYYSTNIPSDYVWGSPSK